MFLEFWNFYRCFINGYFRIVILLIRLLKKSDKGKKLKSLIFRNEIKKAFIKLKVIFLKKNLILIYFDSEKYIKVKTNALLFAVIGTLL